MARHDHNTAGRARDTAKKAYDTARSSVRGLAATHCATRPTTRPVSAATHPQYGRGKATIRSGEGHDTAPGAPTTQPVQRATCVQPRPWVCAHCALDPVLTQDTVLSHCLGSLFMNTVHEVFKN